MYKVLIGWVLALAVVMSLTLTLGLETPADLTVDNEQEPRDLDPLKATYHHEIRTVTPLFEGLVRINTDTFEPEPGLAERWDLSPDGRTYTFHLRKTGRWANLFKGDLGPVTARDFEFAWRRVLDPSKGSEYNTLFFLIENAEAYYNGLVYKQTPESERDKLVAEGKLEKAPEVPWEKVGIKALDDYTFRVTLTVPRPFFLPLTAFVTFMPVHAETVKNEEWFLRPETFVCNGPYLMAERSFHRRIRLVRNEGYWNVARVKSKIVDLLPIENRTTALLSFESGYMDFVDKVPDEVARTLERKNRESGGKGRSDFHIFPAFGTYYYCFNCLKEIEDPDKPGRKIPNPLVNRDVRSALTLALDRKGLAEQLGIGRPPSAGFIPYKSIPGYDGIAYDHARDYNPEKARELLDKAGFADRSKMPPIVILYNDDEMHKQIALYVRDAWTTNLKLDVRLNAMEFQLFKDMSKNHSFVVLRQAWFGDYDDPMTFLQLCQSADPQNHSAWADAEYDKLLADAAVTPDPKKRLEMLAAAERRLVLEERPILPMYTYVHAQMFRPHLRGFRQNPRDEMDVSYMYKAKE